MKSAMGKIVFVLGLTAMFAQAALSQETEASINASSNSSAQQEQIDNILMQSFANEFAEIVNQVQLSHDTAYKISDTLVSDSCVALMNKDQVVGAVGQSVFNEITTKTSLYPSLMKGGTLNHYCPRYAAMNVKQKSMVWVLILTVMAHFESSCSSTAHAKGPNGTAYGFYQLHKGKEMNYDGSSDACVKNASGDPKLASRCALAMLELQMTKTSGDLFYAQSYWDVLRPRGVAQKADDIQRAISKSSLCNPNYM